MSENQYYKCLLCGREKFTSMYQPHRCVGGCWNRKNFKRAKIQPCFVKSDWKPNKELGK